MTDQPSRNSLLARKRAARDERVKDLSLYLPVPSWGGDLVLKLGVLERSQIEKFQEGERNAKRDANFLAMATKEVYMHDPDQEQPGPRMPSNDQISNSEEYVLLQDEHGLPIGLDARFVESLGLDDEAALNEPDKVVLYVFANNTIAQGSFVVRVMRWMENTDVKVSGSLVGEALAQGTRS